ncbi:SMC-Scp complex subunit ScpB [Paenibacillus sp. N1-5-1-14]|uniref:SMC-Scp complex subunit ScpB n=1 Tax=Paenibacillus radicibacter TaxID=2972488 RepID=UPI002158EE9A|nr:SMC-Scp complex subunit ScpB [Paenibacillus radicibacter]MCR8642344.1 SMC-Scp complex subunit ScpB [Paenibacillus radicibacter]
MNSREMKSIIEGLLFAAGDEGLDVKSVAEVLEIDTHLSGQLLKDLQRDLTRERRGIRIAEVAGSYQLTTLPDHAPYFERMAQSPSRSSLSQAALETLAIVAYKQPITRIDVEEIRGVKSERPLHRLVGKGLICEVGRADAIGRPILYGTSKQFLEHFGINSLKELPDSSAIQGELDLKAESRMLFDKLDTDQITFEQLEDERKGM